MTRRNARCADPRARRAGLGDLGPDTAHLAGLLDGVAGLGAPGLAGVDEVATRVDWTMPVVNGLELITALRRSRPVTTMMVTTESEHSQVVRALAAGAQRYLLEPFTPNALTDNLLMIGMLPARSAHL